jgi:hypothetical protein
MTVEWFDRSPSFHRLTSTGVSNGILLHFNTEIPLLSQRGRGKHEASISLAQIFFGTVLDPEIKIVDENF